MRLRINRKMARTIVVVIVALALMGDRLPGTYGARALGLGGPTSPAGSLRGEFDVDAAGQAVYRVLLNVAGGRQGIQPELALVYGSAKGNGHLGMGWSLEGLSEIARCASTPTTAGRYRPVRFDSQDMLCLDGERLIVVSGTAHQNGAVYHPVNDPLKKVTGEGTPHARFRVRLPDGRTASYGTCPTGVSACASTANASVSGSTLKRTWMLTELEDRFGNTMAIEWGAPYAFDQPTDDDAKPNRSTSEHYPKVIRYGGHKNGLQHSRSVTFTYEPRPDVSAGFAFGQMTGLTKRLSRITSSVDGVGTFREYRIAYKTSLATGRSLVESITECAGDDVCHPPTRFGWQDGKRWIRAASPLQTHLVVGDGRNISTTREHIGGLTLADLNGDGRSDLLFAKGTGWDRTYRIALAYPTTGNAFPGEPALPDCPGVTSGIYRCEIDTGTLAPAHARLLPVDYDNDGRRDFVEVPFTYASNGPHNDEELTAQSSWPVLRSTGNSLQRLNTGITTPKYFVELDVDEEMAAEAHAADLNGDGLDDLILCEGSTGPWTDDARWHVRFHDGTGWGEPIRIAEPDVPGRWDCRWQVLALTLDATGDGVADLLHAEHDRDSTYYAKSFTSQSSGWISTSLPSKVTAWRGTYMSARLADVNGDALIDVVADRNVTDATGRLDVFLNRGRNFDNNVSAAGHWYAGLPDRGTSSTLSMSQLLDYNGDGRDDLLIDTKCSDNDSSDTCSNPRWMVLQATGAAVHLGHAGTVFGRTELFGCPVGGGGTLCVKHRSGPTDPPSDIWFGYQQTRVGDVTGDLLPDAVMVENDKVVVRPSLGSPATDRLSSIRDGLAAGSTPTTAITYASSLNGTVVKTTSDACAEPVRCRRPNMYVVSKHSSDAGPGHARLDYTHTYFGPRSDVTGGGFLGFKRHDVVESPSGRAVSVTLHAATGQAKPDGSRWYPFAMIPQRIDTLTPLDGTRTRVGVVVNTMRQISRNSGSTFLVRPEKQTATTTEVSGQTAPSVVSSTSSEWTYDTLGNALTTRLDTGASTTHVTARYDHDVANWTIGMEVYRSTRSTVGAESHSRSVTTQYDAATGAPKLITATGQATTSIKLDEYGNTVEVTDTDLTTGATRTSSASYASDPERRLRTSITNAVGHVTALEYDRRLSTLTKVIDPNGVEANLTHDGFGRLTGVSREGAATKNLTYALIDDGGGASHIESATVMAGGPTTTVALDRLGRPVRFTRTNETGALVKVEQTWDRLGRLATRTIPHLANESAHRTVWTYDALGRTTRMVRPDGTSVTTSYDKLTTTVTDALGRVTKTLVDSEGKPVRVTDARNENTTYTYGPFGSIRTITDAAGNVTTVTTDASGRVTELDDPDSGKHSYTYDGWGRWRTSGDALGRSIELEHDVLDRQTKRIDADGETTFTYDEGPHALGRLVAAAAPTTVETYGYDEFGRPASVETSVGGVTMTRQSGYDDFGRVDELRAASGSATFSQQFGFAADGSLQKVIDPESSQTLHSVEQRNARGQIIKERAANGVTTTYTIDPRDGRTDVIRVTNLSGTVAQGQDYTYDAEGNLLSRVDQPSGVSERFTYDALDRLASSTVCSSRCFAQTITYDKIGNITHRSRLGAYTYDPAMPHAATSIGGMTLTYDAVGNQIASDGETRSFTARNKLAMVDPAGTQTAKTTFSYDAFGRRVRADDGSRATTTVDGDAVEHVEAGGSLNVDRFRVKVEGRTVAVVTKQGASMKYAYLHPDRLGSTAYETDATAKLASTPRFDAFGLPLDGSWAAEPKALGDTTRSDGFTGHRHEAVSDLIDMGGREFDARTGRFLSPDPFVQSPLNGQSLNRYSYVMNNPLRFTDPSGYHADDGYDDFDDGDAGDADWAIPDSSYDQQQSGVQHFDEAYVNVEPVGTGESDTDTDDGDGGAVGDPEGEMADSFGFDEDSEPGELFDFGNVGDDAADAIASAANEAKDFVSEYGDDIVVGAAVVAFGMAPLAVSVYALKAGVARAAVGVVAAKAVEEITEKVVVRELIEGDWNDITETNLDVADMVEGKPHDIINLTEGHARHAPSDWLRRTPAKPGYTDVMVHGSPEGFELADGRIVSGRELAEIIKSHPAYQGGGVRLISCNAGVPGGPAYELANALGFRVDAADALLELWSDGTVSKLDDAFRGSLSSYDWLYLMPGTASGG